MSNRIQRKQGQSSTTRGVDNNTPVRFKDVKDLIKSGQGKAEVSSDATLSSQHSMYVVDTTGGAVTLTFNPVGIEDLKEWYIKREGDNLLTIVPISGSNIDGDTDGIQITEDDATIHLIKIGNNLKILN